MLEEMRKGSNPVMMFNSLANVSCSLKATQETRRYVKNVPKPPRRFNVNGDAYITMSGYPFIGPRFLNFVSAIPSHARVNISRMRQYYSFIKGGNIDLFDFRRDLDFGLKLSYKNFPMTLSMIPGDEFINFNTYNRRSESGYFLHLPYKNWCVNLFEGTFIIRNEIDCVGYCGLDIFEDEARGLGIEATRALNILPSLQKPRINSFGNYGPMVCHIESEHNFIWFRDESNDRSYMVHVTDYDVWNLTTKTLYFDGLDVLLGRTGLVYVSNIDVPDMTQMDGYRFWHWMYGSYTYIQDYDSYHAGSALRMKRRMKGDFDSICNLSRFFTYRDSNDIVLQGASFSSLTGLVSSVNEIGKFAKTANGVNDTVQAYIQEPWFQTILHYLTSVAQNIAGLIQDFVDFKNDPLGYITALINGCRHDFSFPENYVYDSAKTGVILAAALYLYDKSQIISVGLFLFGYHSFYNNCYTDKRYARSAAILTTLVSIGVMKATQLRTASIQLQAYESGLTQMIYAMTAFVTLGFASKGVTTTHASIIKHLFTNTKDIFAISKGTLALGKCVEFIVEAIQKACSFVFGHTFAYEALVKMTITSKDLQEYIQYCLITQPEDLATKLTLDFDSRKQWDRISTLHKDLIKVFASGKPPTETHIGYSMYSRASANFVKLRQEFDKVKDSLNHFRPEPLGIWIWGAPGTGKTWVRDKFVNHTYRWHAEIDPSLPDIRRTGLLYVRNPADKFMSKYNGEFAVAYDDVGQNRQQDNPEFNEIMGFGSTNQVRLNMADLEEKGRLFSSKVIIMCANSKGVVSNNLILKEEAFNRRRHVVIELLRPKSDTTDLTTSKYDFSKVRLVLTDPISGEEIQTFPSGPGYGDDAEEFKKLFAWLAPKYVKHVESQIQGLEKKERALQAVLNGTPDDDIHDLETVKAELPDLDPLLDLNLGKFRRIARLVEYNEDFRIVLEGIRNCYVDGMETPTDLLKTEFNSMLEEYKIPIMEETEWKFLKTNARDLTVEEINGIQDLWDQQIKKIETRFPWIGFLKTAGLVLGGIAVYKLCKNFFTGTEKDLFDLQGYSLETRAQPTPRVNVQRYNLEAQAPKSNKVVIQNNQVLMDAIEPISNIENVGLNLSKSVARFTKILDTGGFSIVNGFNVCFNAWLIPRHFFAKNIENTFVRIERPGQTPEVIEILAGHVTRYFSNVNGKECERDLCMVYLPTLSHGRNHLKHFANRNQLERCRNFNGKIIRWSASRKTTEEAMVGEVMRWDIPITLDYDGTPLYYSSGYKYNFGTAMGDCGSLLMSIDRTTPARIYGIHFGFDNIEQRGLSYNIPFEDLEILVSKCIPNKDKINSTPPLVEIQSAECPQELINPDTNEPYFEHLGYVRDAPLPPRDHGDLHRSPLFDDAFPAEKDLSVLHKFDKRMDPEFRGDPDILTRGVIDFAYESIPWPTCELSIAQEALKGEFYKFTDPLGKRILSLDEAINGVWCDGARLEYSEPINLKTSAGYSLAGTKRDHFITCERFDDNGKLQKIEHAIGNEKLQQQVDDMWSAWMVGDTYSIPWSHTLKIEAVKMSKIKNGNTRTFCVSSTAFLLNVRRLFGAFTTAMKASRIKSFSCLGVDANSQDWNALYNNLISTGQKGADMDFFKFDRTAVTWQLARAVCEVINDWYDDGEVNARARLIAFEDMIFAYGLINKHLTRKRRGNPSGNPITTEMNNCVNYLMLCMVYLMIAKTKNPECYTIRHWKKFVNMKAYGDDIIFTLHPECVEWFDFTMLAGIYAKYGVPVTPADKSDDGIVLRPLHELTFLKRNFRPFDHPYVKWQSALSQTSIKNMVQFYRLKPNNGTMMEAVVVNCHESLTEAYHWGRDFFEEVKENINNWMKQNEHPLISVSYEELDLIFRKKLEN